MHSFELPVTFDLVNVLVREALIPLNNVSLEDLSDSTLSELYFIVLTLVKPHDLEQGIKFAAEEKGHLLVADFK